MNGDQLENARLVLVVIFLASVGLFSLAIIVFDVWAWHVHGKEATASALIHGWAKAWPIFPFILGGLNGLLVWHLFW